MPLLDSLFRILNANGGSDLHIATDQVPRLRLHGVLVPVDEMVSLDAQQVDGLLREIVSDAQWEEFQRSNDLDFAYSLEGIARFRANYFRDHSGQAAVFRIIPSEITPIQDLGLPAAIERFAHFNQGLVLVTGPTGSGKSTTLASILDCINSTYARHIVTIEDPIEFVHQSKKSVVTQREIGNHSESFASALKAAIRMDPDVILVGEMRDLETIHLAITAAEMGVLVFGTLHTNSAAKTIDRIIDAFPSDQQDQARTMLAESLAGIVSQLLLRRSDKPGRVAATEVLVRTSGLANIIREGNISMLVSIIQSGKKEGMQLMDDSLMGLVEDNRVSAKDAFLKAIDKSRFDKLLD